MLKTCLIILIFGSVLFLNKPTLVFSQTNTSSFPKSDSLKFALDGDTGRPMQSGEKEKRFFVTFNYIQNYLNKHASIELKQNCFQTKEIANLYFHVTVDNEVTYPEIETNYDELKQLIKDALKAMSVEDKFLKSNTNYITNQYYKIYVYEVKSKQN